MDPYREVIEARITELLKWRRWLRQDFRWLKEYLEPEYNVELRALVKLARQVRRMQRLRLDADLAAVDAMFRGDHFVYPKGVGR